MLGSPNTENSGENETRHHGDAGRLSRNRWFEPGSLQRRVGRNLRHKFPLEESNFEQTRLRAGNRVYIAGEAPWGEIGAVAQRLIERDFTGKAVLHI